MVRSALHTRTAALSNGEAAKASYDGALKDGLVRGTSNRILAALSENSFRRLAPALERIQTKRSQVLSPAGSSISHVYFVESGMVSLVRPMQDGDGIEIGTVGREGVVPLTGPFDADRTALEAIVQIPGSVLAIRRETLKKMLAVDRQMNHLMRSYASAALGHLTQTAACNILHSVEARYCRWLLTAHDNVGSSTFRLTHEVLGMLLGVRRASVSVAADKFRRAGLILYCHGNMTITNRSGLEELACECYHTARQEFDSVFARRAGRPT